MTGLTSQLALGILSLPSKTEITEGSRIHLAFTWILGMPAQPPCLPRKHFELLSYLLNP